MRQRTTGFVVLLVFVGSFALSPGIAAKADGETQMFVVKEGYLSASIRQLVYEYEWTLVWESAEDRVIDRPFHITNPSLGVALSSLLAMYKGAFVADLYRGNRVVHVTTPSPGVYVNLPVDMVVEEPQPEAMMKESQENTEEAALARSLPEDSEEQAAPDEIGAEDSEEQVTLEASGKPEPAGAHSFLQGRRRAFSDRRVLDRANAGSAAVTLQGRRRIFSDGRGADRADAGFVAGVGG